MIEATCSACGTLNRVSEANVPAGAKFIACGDCKARIAITSAPPAPPAPKLPPPIPSAASARTSGLELADLPAPKRPSSLGPLSPATPPPMPAAAKPAPRGLAAALDPELPAPKMTRSAHAPTIDFDDDITKPPGTTTSGTGGLGGVVDLPAPKRPAPRPPVGDTSRGEIIDLPAPKLERHEADLLAPKPNPRRSIPQVPAPPASASPRPIPRAVPPSATPVGTAPSLAQLTDLPAPRDPAKPLKDSADRATRPDPAGAAAAQGPNIPDLPAPRPHDAPRSAGTGDGNLPAPKGFFDDLPQSAGTGDGNLPAPKGFFDDLPTVKSNLKSQTADLPAPKGFFEDLPTVKSNPTKGGVTDVPAPKGYFDDIPGLPNKPRPEVPAPKGFFDDIPGLPSNPKPEVPAPKGFFDDIPGLPSSPKPEAPAPKGFFDDIPGLPSSPKPEAPAPKGFFDDIPGLPSSPRPEAPAPKGFFDDIPQPGRAAPGRATPGPAGSRRAAPEPAADEITADEPAAHEPATHEAPQESPQEIELQLASTPDVDHGSLPAAASPPVAARPSSTFDDLDLSRPSVPVRFDPPTRPSAPRPLHEARVVEHGPVLELEAPRPGAPPPVARRPGQEHAQNTAAPASTRPGRNRLVLIAALVAAVLAVGGFVLYRRHVAAAERQTVISEQLAAARKAYAATEPKHWQRAAAAARRVIELDETNPEALGIGAESLLASALDDGTGAASKIAQAHAMLDTAHTHGISTPVLTRARALAALAAHQPDTALAQLTPLTSTASEDGALALYIGWARAARGDAGGAVQSFTQATSAPGAKLSALYGRGNARLELAELEGARADFTAVLELAKDHVGAQVGLAASQPPAAAQRREAEALAILDRKDIATADPRAVARAWTLAGDAAMRAGRYDIARERFRKALALTPQDLATIAALAETELRDGKIGNAASLTAQALQVSADSVAAQLVQSEIEIKQRNFTLAGRRLEALATRTPPLAPLELARLQVVRGKLADAQGDGQAAAEAFIKGAQIARDLDLDPMVAAVGKLATLARTAIAEHASGRADTLRARTDELLGNFAGQAARDPQLALTLGISYLQAGNADKAESWLRRAVDGLAKDAEARFQLGRALLLLDRAPEALDELRAALALDPARLDITAELARTFEALQRDTDATALYGKLLSGPDPGLELRARAGRFYARTGALTKAAEQGEKILAVDPRDPAGHYLKGEGMLAAGKLLEARQQFQRAVEGERDAQYLDALGRSAEAIGQGGDRDAQELALRSYAEAAEAAPAMINPLLGQGRLYLLRHEAVKAVPPLSAAVRLDPHNAEALFLLGAAYQDSQRPADARRWLGEAVKIAASAEAYWRIAQLERDANHGPAATLALTSALRLAGETETRTGKPVPWLTDALYLQGRVNLDLHNEPAAREAWQAYVARNPPPSAQLTEVKQLLATMLRR